MRSRHDHVCARADRTLGRPYRGPIDEPDPRTLAIAVVMLRPGDEIEITWHERAIVVMDDAPRTVERRAWARMTGTKTRRGHRYVVGRTTLGLEVTTHERWISAVRVERCGSRG